MMSRLRIIAVAPTLALWVYVGATAADSWVGDLTSAMHTLITWNGEFDPSVITIVDGEPGSPWDAPIITTIVLLLLGGLPVAVFGLTHERTWRRIAGTSHRPLRVPYAVLLFQIVSIMLSALWLVSLSPRVFWALGAGIVDGHDLFIPAFLVVQIGAGIAVIPIWKRLSNTSRVQSYPFSPLRAHRAGTTNH